MPNDLANIVNLLDAVTPPPDGIISRTVYQDDHPSLAVETE
jgi:hypothetical protein